MRANGSLKLMKSENKRTSPFQPLITFMSFVAFQQNKLWQLCHFLYKYVFWLGYIIFIFYIMICYFFLHVILKLIGFGDIFCWCIPLGKLTITKVLYLLWPFFILLYHCLFFYIIVSFLSFYFNEIIVIRFH